MIENLNEGIGAWGGAYHDIQYYKFYIILQNFFMNLTFMKRILNRSFFATTYAHIKILP